MNEKVVNNRVHLMGGLGNQLFQLAFGLTATSNGCLEVVSAFGSPRLSKRGCPEIFDYELPKNVILRDHSPNRLVSKLINFQLKSNIRFNEASWLLRFSRILLDLILSLSFRGPVRSITSQGVGYSQIELPVTKRYLIGYFQSWKWLGQSLDQLLKLKLVNYSYVVERYSHLAKLEKPVLIHFRLGDYKHEVGIGVLGISYYTRALAEVQKLIGDDPCIWVFSDEINEAKAMLQLLGLKKVRFIDEDISSAETLEIMRLCEVYIIANSTFSYWGATLSHKSNPLVIAPTPWFQNDDSPIDLLPERWLRIATK